MKKVFFLLFLVLAVHALGQESVDKPVLCGPSQTLFSFITGPDYKEQLYWIGKTESEDSKFALLVNAKTRTWTIVEFNNDLACILGTGVDYKNLIGLTI
jgi:hypothetical protein